MKTIEKDVVIIGAGLTGLTLAYYLKKQEKMCCLLNKATEPEELSIPLPKTDSLTKPDLRPAY